MSKLSQRLSPGGRSFAATRAFHQVEGMPFRRYCDHLASAMERTSEPNLTVTLTRLKICNAH